MKKVKFQFIVCESECEALRIVLERLVLRQLERIDSGIFFFIRRLSSLPSRPKFQLRRYFFLYFRSIKNFSAFSKCCHSRFTFNLSIQISERTFSCSAKNRWRIDALVFIVSHRLKLFVLPISGAMFFLLLAFFVTSIYTFGLVR